MEELWTRLEKWQNNFEAGMTADKYLAMCDQLGEEPNLDKIPPEVHDFPVDVQKAMVIFNKLGDRVQADVGYLGKDYTQLPVFMDVYEVEDRKMFLEVLLRLDAKLIQKSAAQMKAARDKIRRS